MLAVAELGTRDRTDGGNYDETRPFVVRLKSPLDGETVIEDQVKGQVTFQNRALDDLILLRSDGSPTYNLAVVVDDHDMGITHVIRGDDHLNNAARQTLIYQAMGFPSNMFTVLFTIGRLPGWIAHWREQSLDPATKIGRPRQIYTGHGVRDYPGAGKR